MKTAKFSDIRPNSRVTIKVPNGTGPRGVEYAHRTGRAVMRGPAGWVIDMGGRYGTPGIASPENIVKINGRDFVDLDADIAKLKEFLSAGPSRQEQLEGAVREIYRRHGLDLSIKTGMPVEAVLEHLEAVYNE